MLLSKFYIQNIISMWACNTSTFSYLQVLVILINTWTLTCNLNKLFDHSHSFDNVDFSTHLRNDPVHLLIDKLVKKKNNCAGWNSKLLLTSPLDLVKFRLILAMMATLTSVNFCRFGVPYFDLRPNRLSMYSVGSILLKTLKSSKVNCDATSVVWSCSRLIWASLISSPRNSSGTRVSVFMLFLR